MQDTAAIMMVTYNRVALTEQTLDCLFKNTHFPFNLIIVDNASEDGTKEFLEKYCTTRLKDTSMISFSLYCNDDNKGIAIARNQCLNMATDNWLVTIDNDVWVPDNWLTECIDILKENPQYASIGVNMENRKYPEISLKEKTFQNKPQGNLGTACMVFNRTLHKMLGFFNYKDYGKYGEEDADWGMRTRVLGLKLGYIATNGRHLGEGELDQGEYREFKTASHTRNLAVFNQNCRSYMRGEKPIYIPFDVTEI